MSDTFLKEIENEKIGILMGGDSNEATISRKSAQTIYEHLRALNLNVDKLEANRHVIDQIKSEHYSLIYNALHGQIGEDGTIQANLDFNGIPYTGEGQLTSALCFDKVKTKNIFDANFVKTPKYLSITPNVDINKVGELLSIREITFPVVLKPISSGSSIGIQIAKDQSQLLEKLKAIDSGDGKESLLDYYIEEKIDGREITVGICFHREQKQILPVIELLPKNEFYDFEAKYTPGMTEMIIPADLSKSLKIKVESIADKLFVLFGFRECVRIDFMIDKKHIPHVLEINTSPGMTQTSDIPKMLEKGGYELKEYMVENLYRAKKRKKSFMS